VWSFGIGLLKVVDLSDTNFGRKLGGDECKKQENSLSRCSGTYG
jgi:hypothetical protein